MKSCNFFFAKGNWVAVTRENSNIIKAQVHRANPCIFRICGIWFLFDLILLTTHNTVFGNIISRCYCLVKGVAFKMYILAVRLKSKQIFILFFCLFVCSFVCQKLIKNNMKEKRDQNPSKKFCEELLKTCLSIPQQHQGVRCTKNCESNSVKLIDAVSTIC